MRTHGTLTKWNDERGYGFVTLPVQWHRVIRPHLRISGRWNAPAGRRDAGVRHRARHGWKKSRCQCRATRHARTGAQRAQPFDRNVARASGCDSVIDCRRCRGRFRVERDSVASKRGRSCNPDRGACRCGRNSCRRRRGRFDATAAPGASQMTIVRGGDVFPSPLSEHENGW